MSHGRVALTCLGTSERPRLRPCGPARRGAGKAAAGSTLIFNSHLTYRWRLRCQRPSVHCGPVFPPLPVVTLRGPRPRGANCAFPRT